MTTRRSAPALIVLALAGALTATASAQQPTGQRFASVEEALVAQGILTGRPGPASVNWIDGGTRFSYTTVNPATRQGEIRRYDPASLRDEAIFQAGDLTMPGTGSPLAYRSSSGRRTPETWSSRWTSVPSTGTRGSPTSTSSRWPTRR